MISFKQGASVLTAMALLLITLPAVAKPNTDRVISTNNRSDAIVTIPAHAVEVADNVFSLGCFFNHE